MKKLSILLLAFVAFAGISSCTSDDDVVFIAQPDPEGINFVNTFNETYILTAGTGTNVAERFVWNTVDFDVPTNITYELQGTADPSFETFDVLGATGNNNLAVTVNQLRSLAQDAGLDNDPATDAPNIGQLYFRVRAFAGTDGGNPLNVSSEERSITIILPEAEGEEEEVFKDLFLVGDATAAGWDPNNNNTPLFRSADNPNVYSFTGYFGAGEFKLLETTAWQPQWGVQNGDVTSSDILGEDPGAFTVSSAGYYTFTVDIDEMTYSFEPFDASGATVYDTMGVIGDATPGGWDEDTDMTQSEFDDHIWYVHNFELGSGEFKFRADDDWADNWGIGQEGLSGTANYGSPDNMSAPEGTYDIWFNDLTGRYILIPVE